MSNDELDDAELFDELPEETVSGACDKLQSWPWNDPIGAFAFLKSLWYAADWGWNENETNQRIRYRISTAGWSDNEVLINSLTKNPIFCVFYWQSWRRGGHYEFIVPRSLLEQAKNVK